MIPIQDKGESLSLEKLEEIRLYSESRMFENWDRKDAEMVGVFYNYYIEKLIQELKPIQSSLKEETDVEDILEFTDCSTVSEFKKEWNKLQSSLIPWSIIEDAEKIKEYGVITYKVMIRQSSTMRDGKGNVIIPESDLLEWFGRGLHLHKYTSWDTI